MKATREGIRSGSPDGLPWQQRSERPLRKDLSSIFVDGGRNAKGHRLPGHLINGYAPNAWFGKLPNALGYEYEEPGRVKIGWRSTTADREATNLENGQTHPVTAKNRIYWGLRGHPLKWDRQQINLPKRPIFEPMWKKLQPEIPQFIESKLTDYLSGAMTNAAGSISKLMG
jgi:hypothetical protein